jgi:hypothetical protein
VPLPSNASEPFVGQIELVSILADKPIRYGALLGNDLGHPEGGDDALRAHREPYLEPVNPLGLRSAPAEGSLPAEEPFARSSHPHDGRDEGSIQHVVGGRGLGQSSVSTAESASKAGRPGLGVSQEREAFHQSSTRTYNEIKKESRSSMGPSFGESLVHQHTVLAPSPLLRITHQPSKGSEFITGDNYVIPLPKESVDDVLAVPFQNSTALLMPLSPNKLLFASGRTSRSPGVSISRKSLPADQVQNVNDIVCTFASAHIFSSNEELLKEVHNRNPFFDGKILVVGGSEYSYFPYPPELPQKFLQ